MALASDGGSSRRYTSLARATLIHEWRRFTPGVLSVAFAGILILVQLGLLLGMFGTITVFVDRSHADLWVTSPETPSFDQARDIPDSLAPLLYVNPAVQSTETVISRDADWRSGTAVRVSIVLIGLQARGDSLGCPSSAHPELCDLLAEPMTVAVDRSEVGKLGTALDRYGTINGRRVRVAYVATGLRGIGTPYVFCSGQTARALSHAKDGTPDNVTFILAKLRKGAPATKVRDDLQAFLHRSAYRVWTTREFSNGSQRYWLFESGVGAGFLFSSLLGLVVGVTITSQTMRSVVLNSLREYATLRAIGIPASALARVVLEQSLWIGLVGAGLTLVAAALAYLLAVSFFVPLELTWWSMLLALAIGLVTAVISGFIALRDLYRLQPAELLR